MCLILTNAFSPNHSHQTILTKSFSPNFSILTKLYYSHKTILTETSQTQACQCAWCWMIRWTCCPGRDRHWQSRLCRHERWWVYVCVCVCVRERERDRERERERERERRMRWTCCPGRDRHRQSRLCWLRSVVSVCDGVNKRMREWVCMRICEWVSVCCSFGDVSRLRACVTRAVEECLMIIRFTFFKCKQSLRFAGSWQKSLWEICSRNLMELSSF